MQQRQLEKEISKFIFELCWIFSVSYATTSQPSIFSHFDGMKMIVTNKMTIKFNQLKPQIQFRSSQKLRMRQIYIFIRNFEIISFRRLFITVFQSVSFVKFFAIIGFN